MVGAFALAELLRRHYLADADDLEHANSILNELGIRTELDYELTASKIAASP